MDTRARETERLDGADEREAMANRGDLRRINSWFGGDAIMRSLIGGYFRPNEEFTVIDVGAAWGDGARSLRRSFPRARVTSYDIHARLRHADPPRVRSDAMALPFRDSSFDIAIASLLLHHFTSGDAATVLRNMGRIARRGVAIVDLSRHRIPYCFLPATSWLFGWHPLTTHDGRISVASGFRVRELRVKGLYQIGTLARRYGS